MKKFVYVAVMIAVMFLSSCEKTGNKNAGSGFYGMWELDKETPGDFVFESEDGSITIPGSMTGMTDDLVLKDDDIEDMVNMQVLSGLDELIGQGAIEFKQINEKGFNTFIQSYTFNNGKYVVDGDGDYANYTDGQLVVDITDEISKDEEIDNMTKPDQKVKIGLLVRQDPSNTEKLTLTLDKVNIMFLLAQIVSMETSESNVDNDPSADVMGVVMEILEKSKVMELNVNFTRVHQE